MYNEDRKKKFIVDTTESLNLIRFYQSLFNQAQKYEEKFGKDLCEFNEKEADEAAEGLVGLKTSSSINVARCLRTYGKWCVKNKIDGAKDALVNVKPTGISKTRAKMVQSPMHLNAFLNSFCDSEDEDNFCNVIRCIFWFAYAGIDSEDIVNIEVKDIDFYNMCINYGGNSYPIYREGLKAIRKCCELTAFHDRHPSYKDKLVPRVAGSKLTRGTKTEPSVRSILISASRDMKNSSRCKIKLSYDRAKLSGQYYRMYEAEMSGFEINYSALADEFLEGRVYKTDVNRRSMATTKRYVMKDLRADYERWKEAFDL